VLGRVARPIWARQQPHQRVRVCSLGEITSALFEVGGQYRRSM
jgi:hypothetical protein